MSKLSGFIAAACFTLTAGAQAAGVVIGGPADANSGNCLPFGCKVSEYQQVYAAAQFSGALAITSLTFYNTAFTQGSTLAGTYTIHLSTTSAQVNALSTNFASNLGANNSAFAVYSGGSLVSTSFTITGTSFLYDPSKGNLLLDIVQTGSPSTNGAVYLDARTGTSNGVFSRMVDSNFSGTDNSGLVTGFNVTPVPEPSTAMLALLGFSGVALVRARRRRTGQQG